MYFIAFYHGSDINGQTHMMDVKFTVIHIRRATKIDEPAIWSIIKPVIRAGDSYALDRKMSQKAAMAFWMAPEKWTFVAETSSDIVGTYYMKTNQAGGGAHVCNCGYITDEKARGRGIAKAMCEHSIKQAPEFGFKAMQYNCVLSTNKGAIRLWQRLGFDIVGTIPNVFLHPDKGYIHAHVMYQEF